MIEAGKFFTETVNDLRCYNICMEQQSTIKTDLSGTIRNRGFTRAPDSLVASTEGFTMPRRSTKMAAGYDLFNNTGEPIVIKAGTTSDKISTGVIAWMRSDEYLALFVRSSHGFKFGARLANSTGIVDADYMKEIFVKIRNPFKDDIVIPAGEAIAQGIFMSYLTTDDDSENVGGDRVGGFGSTNATKG